MDMPLAERKTRWERLHACVRDENVQAWTASFARDLAG
jgi:trehalose 6-phosphate synthase